MEARSAGTARPFFRPSLLLALAAFLPAALSAGAAPEKIQVSKAAVKPRPSGPSRTQDYLNQGDAVDVTGPGENGYVPVRYGAGKTGWVAASSLTSPERYKTIEQESAEQAKQTGQATAAYSAAKGWTQEIERQYSKDQNLDSEFKRVDQIEAGPYAGQSPAEIEKRVLKFAEEGKLGEAALRP